ncbi:SDR family NAD(P)-dependent oxidoreductase [Streptomyces noursei]|uniref:SDR family NAD(P)-dependent oxidoreductase n=1 Tax=Streptomyces noursei TaxID=1971 RepID=UPI001E5877C7|nr:SDR family NAD(P)-dependent oxidoreductase [Streptomyces noursei]MCZ1020665.1 SDR family NAD(P)-dependent oxidoreductase [Streptomyces noursei]
MRAQGEGGSLVLVGSPAGQRGNIGQTNYAAAKAGIAAMARTWSMELAGSGITVNAVVPVAATAMTETVPAFAPYVEAMRRGEPLPDALREGEGFGTPLFIPLFTGLLDVHGVAIKVNYGLNKVRFPAPVPVGSRLRLAARLTAVDDVPGGVQVTVDGTVEIDGGPKPACVLQSLSRFYA